MLNWSLTLAPLLPIPLIAGLGVAGLAMLVIFLVSRQYRILQLRALALGCLVMALLNPTANWEDRETLQNVAIVVSDKSDSQKLGNRAEDTESVTAQVVSRIKALGNLEVRLVEVAHNTAGEDKGTQLFQAVADASADIAPERLAGVVMVTDGQVHDAPSDMAQLGINAPLHALLSGHDDEMDRRLQLIKAPRFGLVGKTQTAVVRVEAMKGSQLQSGTTRLSVRRDGKPVSHRSVPLNRNITLDLDIAHGGETIFEIEVETLENELSFANNTRILRVEGVREKLRVLLVSGTPHAGERVWRSLLKSDPSVDLVHFTILRPPEKQDSTPIDQLSLIAFPTRELFSVKLHEFDLIIFDRYQRRGVLPVLYYDNIAQYVREGGAVLLAAGPDYAGPVSLYDTSLGTVLPAQPTGDIVAKPYRASLSTAGKRHPITRILDNGEGKPPTWSRWFRLIAATPRAGTAILEGPDAQPLLMVDRVDEGRVAVLLSDHVWLWARNFEGGGPHQQLLRRTAHWLMQEPELEEEALRARIEADKIIVERQTILDAPDTNIEVTRPDGTTSTLALKPASEGVWRGEMPVEGFGLYRAGDGERVALAHFGSANPREMRDVISTDKILGSLVRASGGLIARFDGKSGHGSMQLPNVVPVRAGRTASGAGWMGLRIASAYELKGVRRYPLLGGLIGLAILLGVLSLAWMREAS